MAIKVDKKKKEIEVPKGLDIFFYAMVFLFLVAVGGYFFMLHINQQAEEKRVEIEEEIERKRAEVPEKEKMEERARRYYDLIEDFQMIVSGRYVVSPFFEFFEESIHPVARVSVLDISPSERSARVMGTGEDFTAVGQQFYALKEKELVQDVALSSLSTVREDEEFSHIEFVFELTIAPGLFGNEMEDD